MNIYLSVSLIIFALLIAFNKNEKITEKLKRLKNLCDLTDHIKKNYQKDLDSPFMVCGRFFSEISEKKVFFSSFDDLYTYLSDFYDDQTVSEFICLIKELSFSTPENVQECCDKIIKVFHEKYALLNAKHSKDKVIRYVLYPGVTALVCMTML